LEDAFDPSAVANSLKEDASFPVYQEKVLHKNDVYKKIALICSRTDGPLTSGQITNVLKALDVKAFLAAISRTIKKNSGKFTASAARKKGGTVPKYKLTSLARTEFEGWLDAKS
jgi:hypothetical protein